MKLKIDNFEILISARYIGKPHSQETTGVFLNRISLLALFAAKELRQVGDPIMAKEAERIRADIFRELKDRGFYQRFLKEKEEGKDDNHDFGHHRDRVTDRGQLYGTALDAAGYSGPGTGG